jgi:hypothetical protein
VSPRTPPTFTSFTQSPGDLALTPGDADVTCYRVDHVVPVRGAWQGGVAVDRSLWRLELAGRLAPVEAPFIGATGHVVYTDSATKSELGRVSATPSGPRAVLIPIRKSAEWWALAQDQRQAYFDPSSSGGHIAIGNRFAAKIYRRLYHSRYLPGSDWDFLTYFEFTSNNAGAFSELLTLLRDPHHNPEWGFVDREVEIWMTRV